jgi:hypothetical protein
MMWWGKYIGIPYADQGASFAGVDCRGVIRLAWKTELGRDDFPAYAMISASDMVAAASAISSEQMGGNWQSIPEGDEQPFDVAVIWRLATIEGRLTWGPFHLGLVTDAAHVLHCDEKTDTVRLPFRDTATSVKHLSWGKSRFDIWRLRGLDVPAAMAARQAA